MSDIDRIFWAVVNGVPFADIGVADTLENRVLFVRLTFEVDIIRAAGLIPYIPT